MADNLTDTAETRIMDWLNPSQAAPARPVGPLKLRLMSANGSDTTAGTEITGDTYTPQDVTLAAGNPTSNTALISYASLDSATQKTVVGVEVWDSAGTPVRWWHGPLAANKIVNAGDPFEIPIGDLDLSMG